MLYKIITNNIMEDFRTINKYKLTVMQEQNKAVCVINQYLKKKDELSLMRRQ